MLGENGKGETGLEGRDRPILHIDKIDKLVRRRYEEWKRRERQRERE